MWKKPYHPTASNTVSQSYNDGVVTVYSVENGGEAGDRPVEQLTKKLSLMYEERRAGIQRYYAAQQNQVKVERVIRCQNPGQGSVTSQDVAITEDGSRYEIHMVQIVPDVFPASIDVTLSAISQDLKKAEVTPDDMA